MVVPQRTLIYTLCSQLAATPSRIGRRRCSWTPRITWGSVARWRGSSWVVRGTRSPNQTRRNENKSTPKKSNNQRYKTKQTTVNWKYKIYKICKNNLNIYPIIQNMNYVNLIYNKKEGVSNCSICSLDFRFVGFVLESSMSFFDLLGLLKCILAFWVCFVLSFFYSLSNSLYFSIYRNIC